MQVSRRTFFKLSGAALLGGTMQRWTPPPRAHLRAVAANPTWHLLNRITWGVRPEELARAEAMGYEAYLDEQLHPETIDDAETEARLRLLPVLQMDRHTLYALDETEGRSYQALVKGVVIRAVYSKRQLLERMVDFWADHLNVAGDDFVVDRVIYDREVLRKHALGKFRDLIFASAKSPAMLMYLDNYISEAEHPNENYGRELLELHTLGVDGGYTETDVKEVARALTGWTVHDGTKTGFYFDPEMHDDGEKHVLGHTLPAGRGIEDGLHAIDLAVNHPSTARFLSRKLCIRFVADDPPQSLVESTTAVWQQTDGDIRQVMRHILTSQEFLQSVGQKLRRPLDFFIGALRATGTQISEFWELEQLLKTLGQTPLGWLPPDGYPDRAERWMSTGGLVARWNAAAYLTHTAYSHEWENLPTELYTRIGQPQTVGELVDAVASQVFGAPLTEEVRAPFVNFAADGAGAETPVTRHLLARKLASLYQLMLSSPAYQWR